MDKYTYMKEMNRDEMRELLLKGGFCPERVDTDDDLEPFFEDDSAKSCECDRASDSEICRGCIEEFLGEDIHE